MTDHVHAPRVSVREHMAIMRDRLRRQGAATFRALVADCALTLEVVARFLGLLELYRDGVGRLRPGRRARRAAGALDGQHRRRTRTTSAAIDADEEYG